MLFNEGTPVSAHLSGVRWARYDVADRVRQR
jgi:hypothetical protein